MTVRDRWAVMTIVATFALVLPTRAQVDERMLAERGEASSQTLVQALAQTPVTDVALADAIEVEPGLTCLQRARLIDNVQVWLGRDRVAQKTRVVVRGSETQRRAALFDITHGGPVHRRVFDALPEICGDAHAVLSLAIALAIDAEITEQLPEPTRVAVERTLPPQLSVQGALSVELLPDLAAGGDVGFVLGVTSWLRARGDVLALHSRGDTIARSQGTFDATWLGVTLQLCAGGEVDRSMRLWLCVGGASGWVYAQGEGYAPNRHASAPWLGARSGARFELHAGLWWALDLSVFSAALAPTFQTTFNQDVAFARASSATGLVVSLGPALEL